MDTKNRLGRLVVSVSDGHRELAWWTQRIGLVAQYSSRVLDGHVSQRICAVTGSNPEYDMLTFEKLWFV